MAPLPKDRLFMGAPFTNIGLDVFGPWYTGIVTTKMRGGAANSKRWVVLFACLCTRAKHIEAIEEITSSSVINVWKRFIAI